MSPYEALYGRPCRSPICWTEVGESPTTGPNLVTDASKKVYLIRKCLLMARALKFKVGNHVFLKVMPNRSVVRFGKRGKLSPRYIGVFEVLERVATVAYQ